MNDDEFEGITDWIFELRDEAQKYYKNKLVVRTYTQHSYHVADQREKWRQGIQIAEKKTVTESKLLGLLKEEKTVYNEVFDVYENDDGDGLTMMGGLRGTSSNEANALFLKYLQIALKYETNRGE